MRINQKIAENDSQPHHARKSMWGNDLGRVLVSRWGATGYKHAGDKT